jgi:FkbM family methyltransferase
MLDKLKWKLIRKFMKISPDWLCALVISFYSILHPCRQNVLVIPRDGSWRAVKNSLEWDIPSPKYAPLFIEREQPYERYFEIKSGDVVFDVGASTGETVVRFAKKTGKEGIVIAVEPDPEALYSLRKNVAKMCKIANVRIIPKAAWGRKGILSYNLLTITGPILVKVRADTLDNIFSKLKLKKVDFMKIDVDGAELEVLEGAKMVLSRAKYVVLETHRKEDGTETTCPVRSFLEMEGFNVRVHPPCLYAWKGDTNRVLK